MNQTDSKNARLPPGMVARMGTIVVGLAISGSATRTPSPNSVPISTPPADCTFPCKPA